MVATFGRFRGLRFHVRPTQMLESSLVRASGGIGRRAGFRCQWPQGRGGSSPPSRTANEEPLTAACRRSGEGLLRARRPEPGTGWLGPARALAALRARSSGSADFAPSTVRWMRSRLNESSMTALPLEWELPLEREGREGVRRPGDPVAGLRRVRRRGRGRGFRRSGRPRCSRAGSSGPHCWTVRPHGACGSRPSTAAPGRREPRPRPADANGAHSRARRGR